MIPRFQTMYAKAPTPADTFQVQATTSAPGTDFKLGLTSPVDLVVNWGDGNSDTYNTSGVKTHNYASAGTYTVSLSGHTHRIDFYTSATPALLSAVLTPIRGIDGMVTCGNMFYNCTGITSLPDDLFRYVVDVTDFNTVFGGCTALAAVPTDLFRYNVSVTNFNSAFAYCASLTSIPSSLFTYNTLATGLASVFYGCTGLATIPSSLFATNAAALAFSQTFRGCTGITSIPAALFDSCTLVDSFLSTFYGCTGLTGNAPELWTRDPEPTGTTCFYNCTGLDNYASIPAGWK